MPYQEKLSLLTLAVIKASIGFLFALYHLSPLPIGLSIGIYYLWFKYLVVVLVLYTHIVLANLLRIYV